MNSIDASNFNAYISIQPVTGGFVVMYPAGEDNNFQMTTEVATTVSKALKIVRAAVEKFSKLEKEEKAEASAE